MHDGISRQGLGKPQEACGVFGIYAPGEPIAELTYQGLQMVQHRGQQGAGIAVGDGSRIIVMKELGTVSEVFASGEHLKDFPSGGIVGNGHTWYGTAKTPVEMQRDALQPMEFFQSSSGVSGLDDFTIGHNGHVEEVELDQGISVPSNPASDTASIRDNLGAHYLASGDLNRSLHEVLPRLKGAFSLVINTPRELMVARDPQGFRPLHLGSHKRGGWVVASEIAALHRVDAEPVREINPGELLTISALGEAGLKSVDFAEASPALCAFEFAYFSRPDNELSGETVVEVREKMGKILAKRDTVQADMVIGVPESGVAAADGYSWERGIPHKKRLLRNLHVGRTFIAGTQNERSRGVRDKLSPIKSGIRGQRLIVVDDSIVRGTTTKELVTMLREAEASEVHLRVTSPPYRWPCFYGMDTGDRDELLASKMSIDEMCQEIGADSLMFLTNEELSDSVGKAAGKICTACTTGVYPLELASKPITKKLA